MKKRILLLVTLALFGAFGTCVHKTLGFLMNIKSATGESAPIRWPTASGGRGGRAWLGQLVRGIAALSHQPDTIHRRGTYPHENSANN
jgi:hypothetical protein